MFNSANISVKQKPKFAKPKTCCKRFFIVIFNYIYKLFFLIYKVNIPEKKGCLEYEKG